MIAHGASRGLSDTAISLARRATLQSTFDSLRSVALRAVGACYRSPTARAVGYHLPPSGLKNLSSNFRYETAKLALEV